MIPRQLRSLGGELGIVVGRVGGVVSSALTWDLNGLLGSRGVAEVRVAVWGFCEGVSEEYM